MQAIRISYHGLEASEALTALIHERMEQLEQLADRIHSVRVVVDAPHHHQHKGTPYHVRVEVRLPGREIVVGNDAGERESDDDAYQAVRHAFDAVRRRLTVAQHRRTGRQRAHEEARGSLGAR